MGISAFLRFMSLFTAAVAFAFSSYGQEVNCAKANITVKDGVLTIDERNPAVPGLMFKFGSVVGIKGEGKKVKDFNPKSDVLFDPTNPAQSTYADWSSVPYTKENEIIHNQSNVLKGKGDPCRLVGLTKDQIHSGKIDNSKWRLPTREEYEWFVKKYVDPDGDNKHNCWVEKPAPGLLAADGTFFPASGDRIGSRGGFYNVGTSGYYWSAATTGTSGYSLHFGTVNVNPAFNFSREIGFPVRCIA